MRGVTGFRNRAAPWAPLFLFALIAPLLSACFVSDRPLIGSEDAVFPFKRLVYKSSESDEIVTLERRGEFYLGTAPTETEVLQYRFKRITPNVYVVQTFDPGHQPLTYYYGYLTVDLPSKTVRAYKIIAGEKEVGLGLTPCADGQICIDSLDSYLAFVKKALDGGETPEGEFKILDLE